MSASTRDAVSQPQRNRGRLAAFWALTHPGPSLMSALAYAIFAALAAHGRPDLIRLFVTFVGMVGVQFSISTLNDYCDREADRLSSKFKPLATGALPPWVALALTALFAGVMVACYAPYGLTPLLTAGAFLALGYAYDLGVKSTPLGAVLMGIAFPLLPMLAWELFATVKPALFWTFGLGLALGVSISLADALPDTDSDSAAGLRTLAQTLGRHALVGCWLGLLAANALVVTLALTRLTPVRPLALLIAEPLALGALGLAVALGRSQSRLREERLRLNFVLTVLIALISALGWLISAVL